MSEDLSTFVSEQRDVADRATFIVRLWRRSAGDDWEGLVEHVQSGERRGVVSLAAALAELRRRLVRRR